MPAESNKTAVVWSQPGCVACTGAKALLISRGYLVETRTIGTGTYTKEDLLAAVPNARAVPQIFINDEHIGGYPELKKVLLSNDNT